MKAAFIIEPIEYRDLDEIDTKVLQDAVYKIQKRDRDEFRKSLSRASRIVASWPKWKRDLADQILRPSVLALCLLCSCSAPPKPPRWHLPEPEKVEPKKVPGTLMTRVDALDPVFAILEPKTVCPGKETAFFATGTRFYYRIHLEHVFYPGNSRLEART